MTRYQAEPLPVTLHSTAQQNAQHGHQAEPLPVTPHSTVQQNA